MMLCVGKWLRISSERREEENNNSMILQMSVAPSRFTPW